MLSQRFRWLQRGLPLVFASLLGYTPLSWAQDQPRQRSVIIPEEDRFTPFNLVIRRGDIVKWINRDADDHTVVSNDRFNSAGHKGTDHLLPGDRQYWRSTLHLSAALPQCGHIRLLLPLPRPSRRRPAVGRAGPRWGNTRPQHRQFWHTDGGHHHGIAG